MTDLRPIDTSGIAFTQSPPEDLGAAPALEWLPIDRLLLDDSYQRPLLPSNWTAIRKIAANFSWARFQPIVVSPVEGGRYAVVDGQHRAHAAKLIGIESLPAMSCHLSRAEQASAFSWINGNTTAITPFHVYKAALAAREPWAMDCRTAVEEAGCKLMTYNKTTAQKKGGEVYCLALIREHVDAGRAAVVTEGLRALRSGPEADDPLPFAASFLRPWLRAISDQDLADAPLVLAGFLRRNSAHDIILRVDRLHAQPDYFRTPKARLLQKSLSLLLKQHVTEMAGSSPKVAHG